jgi:6-phosphofructokinase 1
MPIIERKSNKPYRWRLGHTPLSKVANKEKKLPKGYIRKDGFGITPSCRAYLEPLIAGEDYPPFKNGLPQYVKLENQTVAKKLAAFELK